MGYYARLSAKEQARVREALRRVVERTRDIVTPIGGGRFQHVLIIAPECECCGDQGVIGDGGYVACPACGPGEVTA